MSLRAQPVLRYVSLGDSYTIGTGTTPYNAWPRLLTENLNKKNISIELVANPARNGFTTANLIKNELPVLDSSNADFVTVLIGVNDWVQGADQKTFAQNFSFILDHVQSKLKNKKNILLVTIPDFGVTPQGALYAGGRDIGKGISAFNDVIKNEAKKRGLAWADIFAVSKKMKTDKSLVADDGLHPSAKGYALWEQIIFPVALKLLQKK